MTCICFDGKSIAAFFFLDPRRRKWHVFALMEKVLLHFFLDLKTCKWHVFALVEKASLHFFLSRPQEKQVTCVCFDGKSIAAFFVLSTLGEASDLYLFWWKKYRCMFFSLDLRTCKWHVFALMEKASLHCCLDPRRSTRPVLALMEEVSLWHNSYCAFISALFGLYRVLGEAVDLKLALTGANSIHVLWDLLSSICIKL